MQSKIVELLFKIKGHSPMYIGSKSLVRLRNFLDGYIFAMQNEGVDWGADIYEDFNEWLDKKYNTRRKSVLWDYYLPMVCGDEEKSFDLFFEEFTAFIERMNNDGQA